MNTIVNTVSAAVTIAIFIALPIYIISKIGFKRKIAKVFLELSIGVILMALPYDTFYLIDRPWADCVGFKVTVFGILMGILSLYHLATIFPKKNRLVYSLPAAYLITYFMAITNLMTPAIVACSPMGGIHGFMWPVYLIWEAMMLLLGTAIIHISMFTVPTKVQKIQATYMVVGVWVTILWAGLGQFLPTFIPGMPFFPAVSSLPIAGIFITIAIVKYKMFSYEVAREKFVQEEKIEVEEGLINAVINEHAAFLAFRRLSAKMPGLIITIKPPNVIRERYRLEKTPIMWLTYFPGGSEEGVSPDKLSFEVMYNVINFVNSGGKLILLHGAEFLMEAYGREYFLDFLHEVNRLSDNITIIIALNGDREILEGVADNIVERRLPIPDPRVLRVSRDEMVNKKDMIIITAKTKEQIERIYGPGNSVIEITKSFSPDRLVFEGMDKIIKIGDKDVFFESFDFVLSSTDPKKVMQFLKDIMDVTLHSGKKVYVLRSPRIEEYPSILTLFED
ncbi:MAG: DUF835 domain-containing protein [Euryarchaeota archaeon]|nr:DUF835 domain-containing protein [Euryarchaeota archaeon]